MYLTKKIIFVFSCLWLILSFLVLNKSVCAVEYFNDDFSLNNLDKWEFLNGSGGDLSNWYIENGNLVGQISSRKWSYLFPKVNNGDQLNNYIFEADVTNISGVDQPIFFRVSSDRSKYYQVDYRYKDSHWPQDYNNITLRRINGGSNILLKQFSSSTLDLSQNVKHKIKVVLNIRNIKVYFDNTLIIDYTDNSVSFLGSGSFGFLNWGGDCGVISKNIFDNVRLTSLDHIDITPTPTPKNKIIILPGLGASWNTEAMVYNQSVNDDQWKMTPFVKNYDGLITSLQAKGLIRDKDFYVWNYDWRRPVSEIETKLDSFINTNIQTGEKVDLIGHSLGGLVARVWSQDHKDNIKLGKVITLSSPNLGSINAYEAWNGAKIFDKLDFGGIALNLLVQLQKKNYQTTVEALKNFAPVVKDLLPTFDFIKKDKKIIAVDKLETKNDFLKGKNLLISSIFDKFRAIVGINRLTKEWINVVDRNAFDKILGVWADGKPSSYTNTNDGDGVVLKKSGKFEGDGFDMVSSDHGNIVDASINKIFNELGLGATIPVALINNDLSNRLVFFIGSPAYLSVKCDNNEEIKSDEMGFVIIKNNNFNKCKILVNGTGNGTYHLVTGKTENEESWQYFENEINTGDIKALTIEAKTGKLSLDIENSDYLYELVKKDVEDLLIQYQFKGNKNLMAALDFINSKNISSLTDKLFLFRKEAKEMLITNRIIERIVLILTIENKNILLANAKNFYNKALQSKSLVDNITRLNLRNGKQPSVFSSLSYQKMEEFLTKAGEQLKLGNLGETTAKSILVSKLSQEIW